MWSYYGSKSKVINVYPKPKFDTIIEPFAGSARYALKYFEKDVILNDKYEIVSRIWKFLQQCSPKDILNLPELKTGDKIKREDFDCIEMAWLVGFMINSGVATPMLTMSSWGQKSYQRQKKDIAAALYKIKHWKITNINYTEIENVKATWFIDAPYQVGGYKYKHNKIDFNVLKEYCMSRKGQQIVCENTNADWMPFKPVVKQNGTKYRSVEAIWSNYVTSFDNVQIAMIID